MNISINYTAQLFKKIRFLGRVELGYLNNGITYSDKSILTKERYLILSNSGLSLGCELVEYRTPVLYLGMSVGVNAYLTTLMNVKSDSSINKVSLTDEIFKNKVVVVQIMGSWCPNCLDESRYYSEFYKENQDKNIEFVALAFEYAKTEALAFKSIERLRDGVGINYPILLAQYGTSDKEKAQEKLPMLNHVLSYPTTIILDKKGKVRKIHTGFNGPATGEKYVEFKKEFESFIQDLLAE